MSIIGCGVLWFVVRLPLVWHKIATNLEFIGLYSFCSAGC